MELVVAQVERGVDRLEGLKINVHLLLFAIFCKDSSRIHNKPIIWNLRAMACCVTWAVGTVVCTCERAFEENASTSS